MIGTKFTIDGYGYGVGNFPGRKHVALYEVTPFSVRPVGYFTRDTDADRFRAFFERVALSDPARSETPEDWSKPHPNVWGDAENE